MYNVDNADDKEEGIEIVFGADESQPAGPEASPEPVGEAPGYDNIAAMADMVPTDAEAPASAYGAAGEDDGCISMNYPLFLRILELVKDSTAEGEAGDVQIHKLSEAAHQICMQKGTLTMTDYDEIRNACGCEGDAMGADENPVAEPPCGGDVPCPEEEGDAEAAADEAEVSGDTEIDSEEVGDMEAGESEEHEAEETPEKEEAEEHEADESEEKEEAEEHEAEETPEEEEAEEESKSKPWEGIRKINDPIMEAIAREMGGSDSPFPV